MAKMKLISFDLDSTLVDPTFTTYVWEIGIPQRYADKYGINPSEATTIVKAEYEKLGDSSLEDLAREISRRISEYPYHSLQRLKNSPESEEVLMLREARDALVEFCDDIGEDI